MSEGFTTEGYTPFPNVYEDNKRVGAFSELPDDVLERKIEEYWQFQNRDDIMPRARHAAGRILEHLGFEIDYRHGCYEPGAFNRLQDEICGDAK